MAIDRPSIREPVDVVSYIVRQLEAGGLPVAPKFEVDLEPLTAGLPTGEHAEERLRINAVIRSAQDGYGWIEPIGGLGYCFGLTRLGVELALTLNEPEHPPLRGGPQANDKLIGQKFEQSLILTGETTTPLPGVFQASYQLTAEEYLRLKESPSPWTGFGAVIATFGLTFCLGLLARLLEEGITHRWEWTVGVGVVLFGLFLLIVGRLFSQDRRRILKAIGSYFKEHPPENVIQQPYDKT